MKKAKILSILSLLFLPIIVNASGDNGISFGAALFMECFVSIHMSLFVLLPLAHIMSPSNSKNVFWTMFAVRAVFLLICDLFIPEIAILDFIAVFIGAFIIVPIATGINAVANKKLPINIPTNVALQNATVTTTVTSNQPVEEKCSKCGYQYTEVDKFCPNCGQQRLGTPAPQAPKKIVTTADFDQMYAYPEKELLKQFIIKELEKNNIDIHSNLIPEEILKRKSILSIIFALLLYVYISAIFFHFPIITYVIGLIIIIIFFFYTRKYDLTKYLAKQVKARPSEKISNIILSTKNSLVEDNKKKSRAIYTIIAIIIPLIMFYNPKIMYEQNEYGYSVRYYCFGITNFTSATIPSEYKGKPVTSLRGNTFSNMPLLKEVNLPETITEIRGQAFKNDINLKKVNIPSYLEYLGGGAFYNCTNLESIYLPDTLTYIGGETFYNAISLEEVHLSEKLSEIRGNTFEYCKSLKQITIPDSVTRIGGHAFYGASSLSTVNISENSKLQEIGSSAFRQCYNLYEITLPRGVYVNERAFKESPTSVNIYGQEDNQIENDYYYNGDYYE